MVDGGITFKRSGLVVAADRVEFNWRSKMGVFSGNVRISQADQSWTADTLSYNVDTNSIL